MDGENTVDYTNTKTVPSPTGIVLEILPFAVLFLARSEEHTSELQSP